MVSHINDLKQVPELSLAEPITVREAVLQLCRTFGMTTIFGNPGSTELPMFRDFPNHFRYILGLQESVVVGMADGFAQATRNAALVNLHSAAGLGHALGNVFTAFKNRTPLVITAGQQARSILPFQPYLSAQEAAEFPKPYVKWSCEPARAEDVPAAIARAYYMAMTPPRGPAFVSIPVDDWDRLCLPPHERPVSRSVRPDRGMISEVADRLSAAHRPALVAGAGIAYDDAWAEMIELAERHQARVWVSPMSGRNSFPEDHPLFAGFLPARREAMVRLLGGHDVIVALGAHLFNYHVEGEGSHIPAGSTLYQLTDDPHLASSTPVGTSIICSVKAGIEDLLAGPLPKPRQVPEPRRVPERLSGETLTDAYLLQEIAALRPKDSIIVEEAPSSRAAMHERLPILAEDGFYTCASGGLGHGLPAAVGVALGKAGRKVIALIGDGSSMYSIQALWSAAQLDLPITFVIVNNHSYEALNGFAAVFGLDKAIGTDLPGLDFAMLAEAQGIGAVTVSRPQDLGSALSDAFASSKPNLVNVLVERPL